MKWGALAVLSLAGWVSLVRAQSSEIQDFIVTEKRIFAIMPPEAIVPNGARHMEWTPTGRSLLILQKTPKLNPGQAVDEVLGNLEGKSEIRLKVWNRATGRTIDLGSGESLFGSRMILDRINPDPDDRLPLEWLGNSDVAYSEIELDLSEGEYDNRPYPHADPLILNRFDFASGTVRKLTIKGQDVGVGWSFSISSAPKSNRLLILQSCYSAHVKSGVPIQLESRQNFVWTLDEAGVPSRPVALENGACLFENWLEDGKTAKITVLKELRPQRRATELFFDAMTGTVVKPANPVEWGTEVEVKELDIRSTATEVAAGTIRKAQSALWLSATGPAEEPAVLLGTGLGSAALSPGLDQVAVLDKGVVTLRAIAPISRAVWNEVAKKQAMEISKLAALGLLMYATDYDDVLPTGSQFGQGVIDPYLKDDRYKGRFVYLFRGGSQTSLTDPANTPLGYVRGPGGYAMAYADGHVNWLIGEPPKPPPP